MESVKNPCMGRGAKAGFGRCDFQSRSRPSPPPPSPPPFRRFVPSSVRPPRPPIASALAVSQFLPPPRGGGDPAPAGGWGGGVRHSALPRRSPHQKTGGPSTAGSSPKSPLLPQLPPQPRHQRPKPPPRPPRHPPQASESAPPRAQGVRKGHLAHAPFSRPRRSAALPSLREAAGLGKGLGGPDSVRAAPQDGNKNAPGARPAPAISRFTAFPIFRPLPSHSHVSRKVRQVRQEQPRSHLTQSRREAESAENRQTAVFAAKNTKNTKNSREN